jgi:transposase-like protein
MPHAQALPRGWTVPDAERHAASERRRAYCAKRYGQPAGKAVERLTADGERLVTFGRFPRDHGRRLRTTYLRWRA